MGTWLLATSVVAAPIRLATNRSTIGERYMKLGFGGVHTDSNQRLMYTSA
jgi:hypothetical protein